MGRVKKEVADADLGIEIPESSLEPESVKAEKKKAGTVRARFLKLRVGPDRVITPGEEVDLPVKEFEERLKNYEVEAV